MPKVKTKSAAKKRFSFTGTGKIKRQHAYKSHILTKKSKKRKRNLTYSAIVHSANVKAVKDMLNMCQIVFTNYYIDLALSFLNLRISLLTHLFIYVGY